MVDPVVNNIPPIETTFVMLALFKLLVNVIILKQFLLLIVSIYHC